MSTAAQAASIGINEIQMPVAAEPGPGAGSTLVFSTGPVSFSSPTFLGTLTSNVWSNDSTNPFGPGALTFTYQVSNSSSSDHAIERLTINSFAGYETDVSYVSGTGLAPMYATRSDGDGSVIGFNFVTPASLKAGQTSALLVVQTNATNYTATLASVIDGYTAQVASAAPGAVNVVPVPAAVWGGFALLGGLGLTRHLRRRREASLDIA